MGRQSEWNLCGPNPLPTTWRDESSAGPAPSHRSRATSAPRSRAAPDLVIADWGPTAELLVFPAGEPVGRGAEFQYRGTIWVVTGSQRDSRIMVAEPISH